MKYTSLRLIYEASNREPPFIRVLFFKAVPSGVGELCKRTCPQHGVGVVPVAARRHCACTIGVAWHRLKHHWANGTPAVTRRRLGRSGSPAPTSLCMVQAQNTPTAHQRTPTTTAKSKASAQHHPARGSHLPTGGHHTCCSNMPPCCSMLRIEHEAVHMLHPNDAKCARHVLP